MLPGHLATLLRVDLGMDATIAASAGEKWKRYTDTMTRPIGTRAVFAELREDLASLAELPTEPTLPPRTLRNLDSAL